MIEKIKPNINVSVVGCPDLTAPERAWIRSDLDKTEIGCIASDEMWTLTCEGTQWTGNHGNCSKESAGAQKRGGTFSLSMGRSDYINSCLLNFILVHSLKCMPAS